MSRGATKASLWAALLAGLAVAGAFLVLRSDSGGDSDTATGALGPAPRQTPVAAAGRLAGYVRDANGNPVAGAEVAVPGGDKTRSDSLGRYDVELPRAKVTVVATEPSHAPEHVTITARPAGGRLDFSLAAVDPEAVSANSADRVILWASCKGIAALSDAALERWIDLGVDGFVCSTGLLSTMGGDQAFSGERSNPRGDEYALQRTLSRSAVVRKAKAGELKLYLGFWALNAQNQRTPLEEWFDDAAWSGELLPAATRLASAARSLGFAGLAIDHELYPVSGGETRPTWSWEYPGNEHSELEVRAKVRQRGRELMKALLAGMPGLELVAYDMQVPESWSEKVQEEVNDRRDQFIADVRIDLWDGLLSEPGYGAIRWFDAIFYKIPHLSEDWATGLQYNANRLYALLSRRLSNWSYAAARLQLSPFAWVDEGGSSEFEAARSPAYVQEQLDEFRKWGMGGSFGIYDYGNLGDFDYGPYRDAVRAASDPGVVDNDPPALAVRRTDAGAVSGTATDDLAIRDVRWYDDRGHHGTAKLYWRIEAGTLRRGWEWHMDWSIRRLPAGAGETDVTIVAEDIKGLARSQTVTVTR